MNASKRKGTSWESLITSHLQASGWPYAERRALAGSSDRGDIAGLPGVVIEAKACRTPDIPGWLREAEAERVNDKAAIGAVWAKRIGKSAAADGYVVMTPQTFIRLLHEAGYGAGLPETVDDGAA